MNFIKRNKGITALFAFGLGLRLVYVIFFSDYVALHYFGINTLFSEASEIKDWLPPIKNFIETGTYTSDPTHPSGYFSRMPGYPIFAGLFYYFGGDYYLYFIGYFQLLLDSICIIFTYQIFLKIFPQSNYTLVAPFLYAVYPVAIFWSPTLFAETLSVFLLMTAIYMYVCTRFKYNYLCIGFILGFAILVRPQVALFVTAFAGVHLFQLLTTLDKKKLMHQLLLFTVGIALTYGMWPIRNYLFHNKLVLTQDIKGIGAWREDVFAYMEYIFSIQTNWEPQMSQIVHNTTFEINPTIAYVTPTDSADLALAVYLSKNYGSGFSHWGGYWKEPVPANPQDKVIAGLFHKLLHHQIHHNAFHYWIINPMQNLKKCFFKSGIEKTEADSSFTLATPIWIMRSLLIFAGLLGSVLLLRKPSHPLILMIIFFFISWYLLISFGPTSSMRNVEIRYLFQTDVLLLIPAAYLFNVLIMKMRPAHE